MSTPAVTLTDFTVDECTLSEAGILLHSEWISAVSNRRLVVTNRFMNPNTWRVEYIHFLVLGYGIAKMKVVTAAEFLEFVNTNRFIKGGA